jgi:hypothetical protein
MVSIETKKQESCGTAIKDHSKREGDTPPRTTRKTTTKKSVSFKHTATAQNTLHIIDYTEEEVKACWYTREEENDTRKTTTEKSVSFKPIAQVQNTLHIINYTGEEVKACWYTREEDFDRRIQIKLTVKAIGQDVDIFGEEDEYCIRGLEHKKPVLARSMYRSRRRALIVVLDEQIGQWQADKDCAYLIAEKYQACAQKCLKGAHRRGLADEKVADAIYFQELPCNGVDRTPRPAMRRLSNLAPLPKRMTSTAA